MSGLRIVYIFLLFFVILKIISCQSSEIDCKKLTDNYLLYQSNLKDARDSVVFLQTLKEFSKAEPGCIKAYELIALFSIAFGQYDEGIKQFKLVLKYDSSNLISLYGLADFYNLKGINDKAFYYVQAALNIKNTKYKNMDWNMSFSKNADVSLEELIFLRSIILRESGKYKMALQDLRALLVTKYEPGLVNFHLSEIYYKTKNFDSARFFYNAAKVEGVQEPYFDSIFSFKTY